jgi:predicted amidohydrolase
MNDNKPWTPQIVKLALAQFSMSQDPSENLSKALAFIGQAAQQNAHICCLPELFRTPYFCIEENCARDWSEELSGDLVSSLSEAAKTNSIALVAGSVYERVSGQMGYNTSLVFNNQGQLLGDYRKVHIPHDPAFYECNYFTAGDKGFKVFDMGWGKISVLICYDQWFPEAARSCALMGAEIIFYPTAIGTNIDVPQVEGNWQNAWELIQKSHSVANSVVVAAVNRVGLEGKSSFWGGSFISNAFGELVVKGDSQEGLIIGEVDLGHSRFTRDSWRFMHSRRPDQYNLLIKNPAKL